MSWLDHDASPRECRACGATLAGWFCESCGGDSFESVTQLYVAELASPWHAGRDAVRRRPATAVPTLRIAA